MLLGPTDFSGVRSGWFLAVLDGLPLIAGSFFSLLPLCLSLLAQGAYFALCSQLVAVAVVARVGGEVAVAWGDDDSGQVSER